MIGGLICATVLSAFANLAGCGASGGGIDGAGGTGAAPSTTAVVGNVDGSTLEPHSTAAGASPGYVFVRTLLATEHTAIAISDFDWACGDFDVTGESLYIDFFEDGTQADSHVTGPGAFPIWHPDTNGETQLPADNRSIATYIVEEASGFGKLTPALSGTVTVDVVSVERIAGSFDLVFPNGELEGTFAAVFCEPWTRTSDIP